MKIAPDTTVGAVHLTVADLDRSLDYYRNAIGLEAREREDGVARLGAGGHDLLLLHEEPGAEPAHMSEATFMSAGGYHHHLGGNIWAGRGATQPPPGSAALRHFTIVLPDEAERDRVVARVADAGQDPEPLDGGVMVEDPAGNRVL